MAKSILSIIANWRIDVITVLGMVTLLLMCDSDDLSALLLTKAAGLMLGWITWKLAERWSDQMPELAIFNDDEQAEGCE